ncbi:uncharacterized protein NECHADRAFT_88231 [Fusarium vanettenii 77-13-4]|uniref:Uncharacterized protein n=1 Tax=Fusarium vanettenii (strain ATCC MYA-4622 / CBS 123669 / FGSC 9596 / NRRL 45880 / 77-13-4) TaxID=660122 RepID=C7ZDS0_FUSV7|nr:uncharacterized protein NECHADRAFT_88231 [Fusarium vanettenii 77-13-4]EEU37800.1 predicted protein [Fusarium vanettenii 77-13-4]
MSTEPGPQQLRLARRIPEIEVLDLRDPPGRIATTRERSHVVQCPPHPYPLDKSPIAVFHSLDEDWIDASQEVLIFTHQVPDSDDEKMRLLNKKSEHFQYYFWTALDRDGRFNQPFDGSEYLWEPFDIRTMRIWWRMCHQDSVPTHIDVSNDGLWRDLLMSSPWFDCPLFRDLLWEVVTDDNGQPRTETVDGEDLITLKRRDPRLGELETNFVRRWWLVASQVPLRRFENGDAVLPITAKHYEARYGTASMQWNIPSDIEDPGDSVLFLEVKSHRPELEQLPALDWPVWLLANGNLVLEPDDLSGTVASNLTDVAEREALDVPQ